LAARLLKGAKANGFSTDLWTCSRIAELIERRYGVRYHVDHIPRLMASLGWSCQKPEVRAVERDEQAIQTWVSKDWPRIKKRRTERGAPRLPR
jgi:transposase